MKLKLGNTHTTSSADIILIERAVNFPIGPTADSRTVLRNRR